MTAPRFGSRSHASLALEILRPADGEWRKAAPCRKHNPEIWFADKGRNAFALSVCNGTGKNPVPCPVRDACLATAMAAERDVVMRHGAFGGKTPTQRWHLAKKLAAIA